LLFDIAGDVPATVVGDPGRLRQVLLNIVGNAVKFTSTGEVVVHVTLEPEHVGDDGRVWLNFAVIDSGIGIPQDKLAHVFEAFTQADASTTRRYGGTGLGLAIARRLVELMDGRLSVTSEEGRGSTFHFTAGFQPSAIDGEGVRPARPRELEGLRVLVVDDHATNRRILLEMLAGWRMKPVAVADALSALKELQKASPTSRRYHAVISDCQMPEVDGYTLAKWIKHDDRLRQTPFVMLTSLGRSEDPARLRRLGISRYLTKPVKHSDLFDALASLFTVAPKREQRLARPTLAARARRRLRILVAEDQAVNRRLVTTILEKRGHTIVQVEDGKQACDALTAPGAKPFDVVVMDLQMPEMGGLEATQMIRQREVATGKRVPIVALTAHAMKGDRDRCLAGGMDEYLSKPIDTPLLIATVEGIDDRGRRAAAAERDATTMTRHDSHAVFDESAALRRTGGDRQLLKELVTLYRADAPVTLRQIAKALAARNAEALRVAAHTLKGSVATVGGTSARHAAATLEDFGKTGSLDGADSALAVLRVELSKLDQAFVAARLVQGARRAEAPRRDTARRPKTRTRSRRS